MRLFSEYILHGVPASECSLMLPRAVVVRLRIGLEYLLSLAVGARASPCALVRQTGYGFSRNDRVANGGEKDEQMCRECHAKAHAQRSPAHIRALEQKPCALT